MSRILIIDDTLDLRDLLKTFFDALGHEVLEASSGRQGLEKIREHSPDIVITDIIMPDMNGIDMIKSLRKFDKRLPVVAMSGYQDELTNVKRLGVAAAFVKPPNLEELQNLVELVLGKKSA
ncbi:response regulator [Pseudobacteriovorax antillogorgiicola]|uniref:Response regulator receiver domain-containing protein n=1 Tax=Pseudobacteriovorax antillogorgiicola TaxID=1513793 RepID=A0A1Y6CME4_9BACT|nr:response regulator [Pseudobacteriovorax antillogorgiicola]TCS44984.1 response regulator receiver domain-containing protein [Pseudobacteriovorax antillogorgiicola]SMF76691.1 Response regulator receiver domain-containing protein [Pseudobacteriovorax antillogorgiicola]